MIEKDPLVRIRIRILVVVGIRAITLARIRPPHLRNPMPILIPTLIQIN